jgi:hypothetical protein
METIRPVALHRLSTVVGDAVLHCLNSIIIAADQSTFGRQLFVVQPDAGHPIVVRKLNTLGSESSLNRHQLRETGGHLTALNHLHCGNRYYRLVC